MPPIRFVRYNADKYQRLGLLKLLVATLDSQRRSTAPEAVRRKLIQLLDLRDDKQENVASLLRDAGSSSLNFRFTEATAGQILDWGRLLGLVGSGNQITERGLLLRQLMGPETAASLNRADFTRNPFILTTEEKIYLLYHHLEIDTPLQFLINRLRGFDRDTPVSGIAADKITCFAFYDTLKLMTKYQSSANLLSIKNLREAVGRMAGELELGNEVPIRAPARPRSTSILRAKPGQRDKKRTKTADHEAIPRFELLTDIGLLEKKQAHEAEDPEAFRKAWRFWTSTLFHDLVKHLPAEFDHGFCWTGFARMASAMSGLASGGNMPIRSPLEIALAAYDAYLEVRRPFGHTPFESVATIAMIRASARGDVLDISVVHKLFLSFKRDNLFAESVRFAAGNDIDRMFIDIKPNFRQEVLTHYEKSDRGQE
jgi:hypothetical protein